jgi:chromosome segregation ATPase
MTGIEAAELAQKLPFPVLIVVLGFILLMGMQQIRRKEVVADGAETQAITGLAVRSTDSLIKAHDRELAREREMGDLKARLAVLEEKIIGLTSRADSAAQRAETLQAEVTRISEELATEKERNAALVKENDGLRRQVDDLETRLSHVSQKLSMVSPDTKLESEKELT